MARSLRRGLLLALLSLPLLLALAAEEAQAQTTTLAISAPADASEGGFHARDLEFTVTLSAAVSSTVNFEVCFTGTATIHKPDTSVSSPHYPDIPDGADYQAVSGIGDSSFTVWNSNCVTSSISSSAISAAANATVGIRVQGDFDLEPDETVTATLSFTGDTSHGVTLGTSRVTHTILDDDNFLRISAPADANEGDSGTRDLEFAVSLSGRENSTVFFRVCFTGSATIHKPDTAVGEGMGGPYPAIPAAADYQAISALENPAWFTVWNSNCVSDFIISGFTSPSPASTVGIRLKGDTDVESNETVIATLSITGNTSHGVTLAPGGSRVTHTILNDDVFSVPDDWALKPADVEGGDSFRLLFVTSSGRNAYSNNIADYNTFVQTSAKAGHSAITDDMGDLFKVVGSTFSIDARQNTATTGTGVPIYWLNGAKVADNYADLYDGSWDSREFRNGDGSRESQNSFRIWTGSHANGTRHNWHFGYSGIVRGGQSDGSLLTANGFTPDNEYRLYALSPVFEVPISTPTESVANVQVAAVDATSASVSWDAVEHATSFEVSWSAESSDSLNAIAGTLPSVTGTSATIQHDASEPMTLTVTVTPEHVDNNGDTKQSSNLAGTATLNVGPAEQDPQVATGPATVTPPPDCVSESLLRKVRNYYDMNKRRAPGYGQNWKRVLLAFGDRSDTNLTPFTAAEARDSESRWPGWKPVREALECIEAG